jgi:hypothetical protein
VISESNLVHLAHFGSALLHPRLDNVHFSQARGPPILRAPCLGTDGDPCDKVKDMSIGVSTRRSTPLHQSSGLDRATISGEGTISNCQQFERMHLLCILGMQYYCEFDEIRDLDELRGANRPRAEKFANP